MKKKSILTKMLILNLSIMLVNIAAFSPAGLNLDISSGNAAASSFGITLIVMSVIIFLYGNHKLLTNSPAPRRSATKNNDITTLEHCAAAARRYIANNVKIYARNLKEVLSQIDRMKKKQQTVRSLLSDKFSETELSYEKFMHPVEQIEQIMILNIKSLLHRIEAFDEAEYEQILRRSHPAGNSGHSSKFEVSRRSIFDEYQSFVEKAVENNEEILLKMDKLILELSKLNILNAEDIEKIDAMAEIDSLIRDAKWYR